MIYLNVERSLKGKNIKEWNYPSSKYLVRWCLNVCMVWQFLILLGTWFHNVGPIIFKFLAPVSVRVLGIKSSGT